MKYLKLVAGILLLAIAACAPGFIINKPYSCSELSERTLAVLPVQGPHDIRYTGDVTNEFGPGDMNTLIVSYLQNEVTKKLQAQSCFSEVDFLQTTLSTEYFDTTIFVDKKHEATFRLPKNTNTQFNGKKAEVLLFTSKLSVVSTTTVNMVYFVPVSISRSLTIDVCFLYWDVAKKEIISTGRAKDGSSSPIPSLTIENWEKAVEGMLPELLCDDTYRRN